MMPAGKRTHWIGLAGPGTPTADGDGGYTTTPVMLSPPYVYAAIQPASVRDLERVTAGTVTSTATHLVSMPYHPGVTTQTVITFGTRTFQVVGVTNPNEANIETIAQCVEQL